MELSVDFQESLLRINEMKNNEINAAAAQMYLLIHRGCKDLELLDKVSDPLLDAEFAGEEHYMNLVKYVAGFNKEAASDMYNLYEDINGYRNRMLYAAIKILEEKYQEDEILKSIMPSVTQSTGWYRRTIAILGHLVSDQKLKGEEIRTSIQSVLDEFAKDGSKLSYLVDKYEDLANINNFPNEKFHSLTDAEWENLNVNVCKYAQMLKRE